MMGCNRRSALPAVVGRHYPRSHLPGRCLSVRRRSMADVLLTHSFPLAHDTKQLRKMQPYPPLGTLYAAAALRSAGISVAVFDPMLTKPIAGFRAALANHRP